MCLECITLVSPKKKMKEDGKSFDYLVEKLSQKSSFSIQLQTVAKTHGKASISIIKSEK